MIIRFIYRAFQTPHCQHATPAIEQLQYINNDVCCKRLPCVARAGTAPHFPLPPFFKGDPRRMFCISDVSFQS